MQFTQSTAALAVFFLALPALSFAETTSSAVADVTTSSVASTGTGAHPHHGHAQNKLPGHQPAGNMTTADKQKVSQLYNSLKTYHAQVEAELTECTKQHGQETCLSRVNGHVNGTLSGKTLTDAKEKYHHTLGKELGECTKGKKSMKDCMASSTAKGDKFQKRGGASDFFKGFLKGFTGVLTTVAPIAASFL